MDTVSKHIWDEESCQYGVPRSGSFGGEHGWAPLFIKFGNEEQEADLACRAS